MQRDKDEMQMNTINEVFRTRKHLVKIYLNLSVYRWLMFWEYCIMDYSLEIRVSLQCTQRNKIIKSTSTCEHNMISTYFYNILNYTGISFVLVIKSIDESFEELSPVMLCCVGKSCKVFTTFKVELGPSLDSFDAVFFFFLLTVLYTCWNSSCGDRAWIDQNITTYVKLNLFIHLQQTTFIFSLFWYFLVSKSVHMLLIWLC